MAEHPDLTEFSGIAGYVLRRSVSVPSLITGVVLTFILLVGNWVWVMAGTPGAATPFTQLIIALAMARFALNGTFGEWSGTIFSVRGGSWFAVSTVTLRYLALTAIWLVPALVFGPGEDQMAALMMLGPAAAGKVIGFLGLYLLGMTLTPPIFLIAAVRARGFGDLFQGRFWSETFAGRIGDLFVIFAIYTGGVGMALVLSVPFVVLAFMTALPMGFVVGGASFCMLIGISANLLGRLCGFFACGELGLPGSERREAPVDSTAPNYPVLPSGPTATPRPIPQGPASLPVADLDPAAAMAPRSAPPGPTPGGSLAIGQATSGAAALAVAPADVPAEPGEKRPPLMDAQQRIEPMVARFAQEPAGVLAGLEDLNRAYAPHPLVLQALCICMARSGRVDEGLALATQALPLCFERGHNYLAAQIFREFRANLAALDLSRDQFIVIGQSLHKMGDLGASAKAFTSVLATDAGDIRAIKGLLQVADDILHKKNKPQAAAKIYRYLLDRCSASPLAEFMHRGLEEAERT